jgi:hypothetical protein
MASLPLVINVPYSGSTVQGTFLSDCFCTAYLWGGGGGAGGVDGGNLGGNGQGGGFSLVTFEARRGQLLTLAVGGRGLSGASYARFSGGGAAGGSYTSGSVSFGGGNGGDAGGSGFSGGGGGGGGASVIYLGTTLLGVAAGGGGGGGGGRFTSGLPAPDENAAGTTSLPAGMNGQAKGLFYDGGGGGAGGGGWLGGRGGAERPSDVGAHGGYAGISIGSSIANSTGVFPGNLSYPWNDSGKGAIASTTESTNGQITLIIDQGSINVKDSNEWKRVSKTYIKHAGVWQEAIATYVKQSGVWYRIAGTDPIFFTAIGFFGTVPQPYPPPPPSPPTDPDFPNPYCFPAGTQVTLENGDKKNIEFIGLGERLASGLGGVSIVRGLHRVMLGPRIAYRVNDQVVTTGDHLFRTPTGWASLEPTLYATKRFNIASKVYTANGFETVNACAVDPTNVQQLSIGSTVLTSNGPKLISSIEILEMPSDTQLYSFVTDQSQTFVANDFVVDGAPQETICSNTET